MSMQQILDQIRSYEGVLDLAPAEASAFPEIASGDHFLYYAPDQEVPTNRQPFATAVTKDYPDDQQSRLDAGDRWRLNVHVGVHRLAELINDAVPDFTAADVIMPHPLYGSLGWIAVVNPADETMPRLPALLRTAYEDDRHRVERRTGSDDTSGGS